MVHRQYTQHASISVPIIHGSKGGKGSPKEDPNNLFSTDIMFVVVGLGEGPIYRINPNGPQDININDGTIDDLVNIDGDGEQKSEDFVTLANTGTINQTRLDVFGETTVTPQNFASPVGLRKGDAGGVPANGVVLQETSAFAWDALQFNFRIGGLQEVTDKGDVLQHSVAIQIVVFDHTGSTQIATLSRTIHGKTTVPFGFSETINIPTASQNALGYRFSISKTSKDTINSKISETVNAVSWNEIENKPQAYPRTAHIGYALKAKNEHIGGIPTFTSMIKGLLVKVPSNYNQPILENGEIDWRYVESETPGSHLLQQTGGSSVQTGDPQIYKGAWDGTFVYSWTQNPAWIVYDILTNTTYGLSLPEENIDKYRFYQIAQYCDACDFTTGKFVGVDALADGTFRHRNRGSFFSVRENQLGLSDTTKIKERRFTLDITLADQKLAMDHINAICASFRGALVYSMGKLTLAVDMPDEVPVMIFNETNMKAGSFELQGNKQQDILSGVDVSYIDVNNHYKRETVRVDQEGSNSGIDKNIIPNITSLDLAGVTRRSQAIRFAQYQIAGSKYIRRNVTFTTSTDALSLAPGDVIAVSQQQNGIAYGFGGKVSTNSGVATNHNVFLEHFTVPSLATTTFTANTGPIALRIIDLEDERIDLYIVSNTIFTLTQSDFVDTGFDGAIVNPILRWNPIRGVYESISTFTANNAPKKGNLWTLGYVNSLDNFYSAKDSKLFKVLGIGRDNETNEVELNATEYISNIYVDSDTFIDYVPTAYTDIQSALSVPPPPNFTFIPTPRRRLDGSIVVDGVITEATDITDFGLQIETEYFISKPTVGATLLSNAHIKPDGAFSVKLEQSNVMVNDSSPTSIIGKNGFSSSVGEIKLLCTDVSVVDTEGGTSSGKIQLTIEGLVHVFDENFHRHVLDTNDSLVFGNLKGADFISIPVEDKNNDGSQRNFVGFTGIESVISRQIESHTVATDIIKIDNPITNGTALNTVLPTTPFYVTINQLLDSRHYNNNSFYVSGSESVFIKSGETEAPTTTVDLSVRPRHANFVRLFIDGTEKSSGQYTVNLNIDAAAGMNANIEYTTQSGDTAFRAEVDYYTVPVIEVGDNVQTSAGNTFPVVNTSFDVAHATYNAAITANYIYRLQTETAPRANLAGFTFINVSPDPTGTLNNVSSGSGTLDYNKGTFPGNFRLANNRVYSVQIGAEFDKLFDIKDKIIKDLGEGVTTLKARNKSLTGRFSPFVTKTITVQDLPIQKVRDLSVSESMYREQTGGISVRATVEFTHIIGQEVTDYEISYKMDSVDNVGSDDGGQDLTSFNTVKVPATGVEDDGKIRFTVSNINRGVTSDTKNIIFKVVPLNKSVRGISAIISKSIIGKTSKPANIFNFTGGQQTDQLTLLWQYERTTDAELADLDLKEVVIRRSAGDVAANIDTFLSAQPLVTVSAGTARKSIPIDIFGEFTYLARTRDTSGNFSDSVAKITIITTRPARSTVVAAYNEDDPATDFTVIPNTNKGESNFPSFTTSVTGGRAFSDIGGHTQSSIVDNANGTAIGFSASSSASDLLATADGEYITQIRDFGAVVTGSIFVDITASQTIQTGYNDTKSTILSGVTEVSGTAGVLKETAFGGIGHILGFSNTAVPNPRFDANNKTIMSGGSDGNVFAIWNDGQYTGNVIAITGITKANPAVVTTSGSEHGLVNGNRIIIHGVNGMTQINNRELYVNRVNGTSVQLYTNADRTSALNSSGFDTYSTPSGVLDQGDYANANSYALIAGTIDADEIRLGSTFHSNGESTGGNAISNITGVTSSYKLVNLTQYNDTGSGDTYAGNLGSIQSQTLIRTSTSDNAAIYTANVLPSTLASCGNVDVSKFVSSSVDNGFQSYQAGSRTFRQFQLKFIVNNLQPEQFDFTIDKFRYTIEKYTVTFTDTTAYDATTKTIDITSAGFLNRPVINYSMIDEDSDKPHVVVTTAASNQAISYQVFRSSTGAAASVTSGMSVMLTATGV